MPTPSRATKPTQMKDTLRANLFIPALLLAVGIALAGFFVGRTLFNAKVGINTAEAKGLSERRVTADTASWSVSFSVVGKSREDVPNLYQQAEANQQAIAKILTDGGLTSDEIEFGIIDYSVRDFRDVTNLLVDQDHTLTGSVRIETTNVDLIKPLRISVNQLVARGMDITNSSPSYHFTGLNEIKPDMLKEAARNARIAATEFAENAGAKVGRIRHARQGAFIIVDVGQSHGDTRSLEKDVRVVTTIEFYLTD